jgi:hypothetical protein
VYDILCKIYFVFDSFCFRFFYFYTEGFHSMFCTTFYRLSEAFIRICDIGYSKLLDFSSNSDSNANGILVRCTLFDSFCSRSSNFLLKISIQCFVTFYGLSEAFIRICAIGYIKLLFDFSSKSDSNANDIEKYAFFQFFSFHFLRSSESSYSMFRNIL